MSELIQIVAAKSFKEVGQGTFVNRSIKSWNMLPDHVISTNNIVAFK